MAQFKENDVVHDGRLGSVTVLEAHDATENSQEQYTVLTDGGEVVRTVLDARGAQIAPEPEVEATAPDAAPTSDSPETATEGTEG